MANTLLSGLRDTIVALATPPGRAGISIIRLSGQHSLKIAQSIAPRFKPLPQKLSLVELYTQKTLIDKSLCVFFKGPVSLTGEDIVEFQCHGSPVVVEQILQVCLSLGARLARPGEYLERAYLNEKYDLAEVEAIAGLIESKTIHAARANLKTSSGALSIFVKQAHQRLSRVRVLLESSLDFSDEEDIVDSIIEQSSLLLKDLCDDISNIIENSSRILKYQTGIDVCFLGPPNAGKSSLLNTLAQDEIALVHHQAGTTRDPLKAQIVVAGIPVTLIDTAGLRATSCSVEQMGIARSQRCAEFSAVLIYIVPYKDIIAEEHLSLVRSTDALKILIRNKIDLHDISPYTAHHPDFDTEIGISAFTKKGIEQLITFLSESLVGEISEETTFVSNMRQLNVIKEFLALLQKSRDTILQVEIAADWLASANKTIGSLTGEQTTEDLLGQIFSTFCIGK